MSSALQAPEETAAAPERGPTVITASVTNGTRGRYLIESTEKVFVADSATRPGGAIAPGPGEFLLTALAVCALGSVERHAEEESWDIGKSTQATATSVRNEEKPTQFKVVHIEVFVDNVTHESAKYLVGKFAGSCPIFNTTRRGGPVFLEAITSDGRSTVVDNRDDWKD
jgi:uncharacterized OsmC-like protein